MTYPPIDEDRFPKLTDEEKARFDSFIHLIANYGAGDPTVPPIGLTRALLNDVPCTVACARQEDGDGYVLLIPLAIIIDDNVFPQMTPLPGTIDETGAYL